MSDLSRLLYKLKLTDQKISQLFEGQLGISLTRYEILNRLLELAPCRQVALQEVLQIDQAAITRHLRVLEEGGYISRQRNENNQREMMVNLTNKAREELVTKPPQQHLSAKEQMVSVLSPTEQNQLDKLLDKLVLGLEHITFEKEEL